MSRRPVAIILVGLATVAFGCARANAPTREPPFVEIRGTPVGNACIEPNCYERVTRADANEMIAAADLARAVQRPGPIPPRWVGGDHQLQRRAAKAELARRAGLAEEEAALSALRKYVACHPWDLEMVFELARRNFELNRFAEAAYLFFQVAEGPETDDLAPEAFMRGLEAVNIIGSHFSFTECFDEMVQRVPRGIARFCPEDLVKAHPARRDTCFSLFEIQTDLVRLSVFSLEH